MTSDLNGIREGVGKLNVEDRENCRSLTDTAKGLKWLVKQIKK